MCGFSFLQKQSKIRGQPMVVKRASKAWIRGIGYWCRL